MGSCQHDLCGLVADVPVYDADDVGSNPGWVNDDVDVNPML